MQQDNKSNTAIKKAEGGNMASDDEFYSMDSDESYHSTNSSQEDYGVAAAAAQEYHSVDSKKIRTSVKPAHEIFSRTDSAQEWLSLDLNRMNKYVPSDVVDASMESAQKDSKQCSSGNDSKQSSSGNDSMLGADTQVSCSLSLLTCIVVYASTSAQCSYDP